MMVHNISISKPDIGESEKKAVMDVLGSGMLAQGKCTQNFEERFADFCGTKYAVATSSGTTALHLALLAHGIGIGDEVITTPFTFIATVNSILYTGATPVFVDIEKDTFNIDSTKIEAAITNKTKAIMLVHLFGHPCEMDRIMEIAQRHGLVVIEDAAQAAGAWYKDRHAGSFGTGCFSFYATKNLTCGEGGMVITNNEQTAAQLRMLRNHGMRRRYYHECLGFNYRMTDIQAAIGGVQLQRFADTQERRRENAEYYNNNIRRFTLPHVHGNCRHAWHQYTILIDGKAEKRDRYVRKLAEQGISVGVFYPIPAHKQQHICGQLPSVCMPIAEEVAECVVSLPVHPGLSLRDLETVSEAVNHL